jgi:F1F0 ATPase subunit 2
MNWIAAVGTGAGMGLAFYGGLWLSVRRLATARRRAGWLGVSRVARLTLVALGFYALSREGIDLALAGLAGLLLVRWYLLRRLGGSDNGL